MENSLKKRNLIRKKRTLRVRSKVRGSSEKPRLSVVKSNRHLSVQLIDDDKGVTVASASTLEKGCRGTDLGKKSKEAAKEIGSRIAMIAKEKEIQTIVFDRGRFKFHGLLAEIATAAREAGLQF